MSLVPTVFAGNALPQGDVPVSAETVTGMTLNVPLTIVDPDGDMPAVFLLIGPEGMELVRWSAQQLLLTWDPDTADIGEHRVVLVLEDAQDRALAVRREMRVVVHDAAVHQPPENSPEPAAQTR